MGCDITIENVSIDSVTLFKALGDPVTSFNDITPDVKLLVISTNGQFKGLRNTNKPKDRIKQRVMNEKNTRLNFEVIKREFEDRIDQTATRQQSKN